MCQYLYGTYALLGYDDTTIFLMCLEVILGVTTACSPVLEPIFVKLRDSMKVCNVREGTSISWESRSTQFLMRISHIWASISGHSFGRGNRDSVVLMEDSRRSESGDQSTAKVEKVLGVKVGDVHVRRDIHVESAHIEV